MRMAPALALCAILLLGAAPRSTSDFEIAALEQEIRTAKDQVVRAAARINLGDQLGARGRRSEARSMYETALDELRSATERARTRGDVTAYARAIAYSGFTHAKLGHRSPAIRAFDEAMRYASNSDLLWNLRASAMSVLGEHERATAAARNALAIASDPLDRNVYRYALASSLVETGNAADISEAESLLRALLADLQSPQFDRIRREVAAGERFEVLSAARGDAAAWVSLQNRATLRLASLLERSGRKAEAAEEYRRVLKIREDDAIALAGLARLGAGEERARFFAASFEANPFSSRLIADYETFLRSGGTAPEPSTDSDGAAMRSAVAEFVDGRYPRALDTLRQLQQKHPRINVIGDLQRRVEAAAARAPAIPAFLQASASSPVTAGGADLKLLIFLLRGERLDAEMRATLDSLVLQSVARFESSEPGPAGVTTLSAGTIESIPFRFPSPTVFSGGFDSSQPLLVQYRIGGLNVVDGQDVLVLEPVGVSTP